MSSYDPDGDLTPSQAEDTVRWVVQETYAVFQRRGLSEKFAHWTAPERSPFDVKTNPLKGFCGDAQCFIDLTLRDYGMDSRPVAMQVIPGKKSPWGHVALTSVFDTTEGQKAYLVDPTFRQFCQGEPDTPGEILANLPGGEEMVKKLTTDGFIELTPARAASYLASFNSGIPPYRTEQECMNYFLTPLSSDMNRYFSREQLNARGIDI